jgi:hypothetical protein
MPLKQQTTPGNDRRNRSVRPTTAANPATCDQKVAAALVRLARLLAHQAAAEGRQPAAAASGANPSEPKP